MLDGLWYVTQSHVVCSVGAEWSLTDTADSLLLLLFAVSGRCQLYSAEIRQLFVPRIRTMGGFSWLLLWQASATRTWRSMNSDCCSNLFRLTSLHARTFVTVYCKLACWNGCFSSPREWSGAISVSVYMYLQSALSVLSHVAKITWPNVTKFSTHVYLVSWPWLSGSVILWWQCDTLSLCASGFVEYVNIQMTSRQRTVLPVHAGEGVAKCAILDCLMPHRSNC